MEAQAGRTERPGIRRPGGSELVARIASHKGQEGVKRVLSPHFEQVEFEKNAPIPEPCIPVLTELCTLVLEFVREKFGPLVITSGYRSPEANAEAHGQSNSEHIYDPAWAAADFYSPTVAARDIFDWMRNDPTLPYHQLILEHGANGSSVVHVSLNRRMEGVRSVLEGATHNAEPYVKVDHVAYDPSALPPIMGVDESTQV